VVPGAVAIIAPIAMGFARRYGIRTLLMGLMVINGASAGGFSPLSIFGGIVNGVVVRNNLPSNPLLLFACTALPRFSWPSSSHCSPLTSTRARSARSRGRPSC
jgi:hypothetical protein